MEVSAPTQAADLLIQDPTLAESYAQQVKERAKERLYARLERLHDTYHEALAELDAQYGLTANGGRLPLVLLGAYANQCHVLFMRLDEQTQEAWREYARMTHAWDRLTDAIAATA